MTRRETIRLVLAYQAWYEFCVAKYGFGSFDVLLGFVREVPTVPQWLIDGERDHASVRL